MFVGHFGVAFAAKRVAPGLSLGTAFLAAQFADLLWPLLVLLQVERFAIDATATAVTPLDFVHYPWSHSLLALAVWAGLFAAAHAFVRRGHVTAAVVAGALVLSHWALDFLVHRPDLPLSIHGEGRYGLGIWNSLSATLVLEFLLFAAGVAVYTRATVPRDRLGTRALQGLVAFLAVIEIANLVGPPPPSVSAVVWTALSMWLLVAWGYWVDRHRARAGP